MLSVVCLAAVRAALRCNVVAGHADRCSASKSFYLRGTIRRCVGDYGLLAAKSRQLQIIPPFLVSPFDIYAAKRDTSLSVASSALGADMPREHLKLKVSYG